MEKPGSKHLNKLIKATTTHNGTHRYHMLTDGTQWGHSMTPVHFCRKRVTWRNNGQSLIKEYSKNEWPIVFKNVRVAKVKEKPRICSYLKGREWHDHCVQGTILDWIQFWKCPGQIDKIDEGMWELFVLFLQFFGKPEFFPS